MLYGMFPVYFNKNASGSPQTRGVKQKAYEKLTDQI